MTPDANHFLQLVLGLLVLSNLVGLWLQIAERGRVQKRQVSFDTEYARRDEVEQIRRELTETDKAIESLRLEWRSDRQALVDAGEDRVRRIHMRVDDLAKEFHTAIHDLPNQVIATLKNTGAIK